LEEKDERVCDLCDPDKLQPAEDPSRDRQLAAIDERIRSLERNAYFEVVTSDGQPVFRVEPGGSRVFNADGEAVAAIGAAESGGYFIGRSIGSAGYASIGATRSRVGVRLLEQDLSRAELKLQDGRASLRFPSPGGTRRSPTRRSRSACLRRRRGTSDDDHASPYDDRPAPRPDRHAGDAVDHGAGLRWAGGGEHTG
jgi:hypothetical protein